MSRKKKFLLVIFILLLTIQVVQPAKNKNNQVSAADISKTLQVPAEIQKTLENSCYDCHSNNTRYPWYTYIQPFGWFLNSHITEGKKDLNFSEFSSYSRRRQISKFRAMLSQINDDEMPLQSYILIHTDAKLNTREKTQLTQWINKTIDSLSVNKK